MRKKSNFARNTAQADFSWARNSSFIPPKKGAAVDARMKEAETYPHGSNLKPLLDKFLDTLLISVNASAGVIWLQQPHSKALLPISYTGIPSEFFQNGNRSGPLCKSCENPLNKNENHSSEIRTCSTNQDCQFADLRFQSMIEAPIVVRNFPKNPAGKLTLFFNQPQHAENEFSSIIPSFCNLIGTVIERNKSSRDAKRADLMAERQAIANEVHDSLAQTLVYARMRASLLLESIRGNNELMSAKYAHDINDALEISQKNVRDLIKDFRCAMDPAGLLHALQSLTEQFCNRNEIELEFINRVDHLELPLEYEIQVFHIVQEALANIATHSGASHARLIADYSDNYYIFTIKDNGGGGCTFTPVEGHYGMMIMRERAQRIGGEIKVASSKGLGTHVQLYFPEPGENWRTANE